MKKTVLAFITASALLLSGCGSVYTNYREVEQLLVIETMGFDSVPEGFELSMAASMGYDGGREPVRLSGSGSSISTAMDQARNYSFEDELFCSQTNGILIGEKAAGEGIEPVLSYICQSPILRTDVPVFIIKGGSAKDCIMETGDSHHGVSEILQGVAEYLETRGGSHIYKASELVRSNLRHGSSLACVLELSPSREPPQGSSPSSGSKSNSGGASASKPSSGTDATSAGAGQSPEESSASASAMTLAVAGFGVLKNNMLVHYIDEQQAVGLSFIINKVGLSNVELDISGGTVVLEISGGSSRCVPRWGQNGELRRLDFDVSVQASVTELNDGGDLSDGDYTRTLSEALEDYVAEQIADTLRISSSLGADFLALGAQVEQATPLMFRHMSKNFEQTLPELEFGISVKAGIKHTNDMKESLT